MSPLCSKQSTCSLCAERLGGQVTLTMAEPWARNSDHSPGVASGKRNERTAPDDVPTNSILPPCDSTTAVMTVPGESTDRSTCHITWPTASTDIPSNYTFSLLTFRLLFGQWWEQRWRFCDNDNVYEVEMCMGMGKPGFPWVPWDSHGIHGMGMGMKCMEMGNKTWEWEKTLHTVTSKHLQQCLC